METACGLFCIGVGGFEKRGELVQASLVAQGVEEAVGEGIKQMAHRDSKRARFFSSPAWRDGGIAEDAH